MYMSITCTVLKQKLINPVTGRQTNYGIPVDKYNEIWRQRSEIFQYLMRTAIVHPVSAINYAENSVPFPLEASWVLNKEKYIYVT